MDSSTPGTAQRGATRKLVGFAVAVLVASSPISANPASPSDKVGEPAIGPLVSGTVSLIRGTHVWTDYAYDDRGTAAGAAPSYPPEAAPGNAADLIQLQLWLRGDGLRVRAVLETLVDPAVPLLGVGLDLDGDLDVGHGRPGNDLRPGREGHGRHHQLETG